MKIKVCGLKHQKNIAEVLEYFPHFIGLIFYEKSPRFIGHLDSEFVRGISVTRKVGVFVNASIAHIIDCSERYRLDLIQLHGDESFEFICELTSKGVDIIKVFRVSDKLPEDLEKFISVAKYFLFDTQTAGYGGSGKQFNWTILKEVTHPFFLSGGIQLEDVDKIMNLELKNLMGIDVNSQFETEPGMKDIKKIKKLTSLI